MAIQKENALLMWNRIGHQTRMRNPRVRTSRGIVPDLLVPMIPVRTDQTTLPETNRRIPQKEIQTVG